ncbi:MAG: 50S ribosomal protein L6 [Flavobacteriales bacterium]|nr:50S ribosomal protein L6 [Flavobacteriales bacterium]
MSRIGKLPISIAKGVQVSHNGDVVKVKGPKGELEQWIDPAIKLSIEDGTITLSRESEDKAIRSKHGLYRALINNMITGVDTGYKRDLELRGVGYRCKASGQQLELTLGYSHPIIIQLPNEIKVTAKAEKGENPLISLECHDKQLLGQVASKLRSLRKPEPYKGKGVRYVGEFVRKKAGKTAAK